MKPSQTPTIPTWLLQTFGPSVKNDEIVGDLAEHFRQGRSPAWFWRQALVAIATGVREEIRGDKMLAGRALFVGWSITIIYTAFFTEIWETVLSKDPTRLRSAFARELWHDAYFYPMAYLIVVIAIGIAGFTGIGLILNRLYRPKHKAVVIVFATSFLLVGLAWNGYLAVEALNSYQAHPLAARFIEGVLIRDSSLILDMVGVLFGSRFFFRRPTEPVRT